MGLLLPGCGDRVVVRMEDGVQVVTNPERGIWGLDRLVLKQAFELQGSDSTFSHPRRVGYWETTGVIVVEKDGTIWQLDEEGGVQARLDRSEVPPPRDPVSLARTADGSIWVADRQGRALYRFRPDGMAFRLTLSFSPSGGVVPLPDGNLVVIGPRAGLPFHILTPEGAIRSSFGPVTEVGSRSREEVARSLLFARPRLAGGPDGLLTSSHAYPYELRQYSPDGVLRATITRKGPYLRVDDSSGKDGSTGTRSPRWAMIDLFVLPDGKLLNLYAETEQAEGRLTGFTYYFDLFDSDGVLLTSRAFPELSAPPQFADSRGRLWAVRTNPEPAIIAYELVLSPPR